MASRNLMRHGEEVDLTWRSEQDHAWSHEQDLTWCSELDLTWCHNMVRRLLLFPQQKGAEACA